MIFLDGVATDAYALLVYIRVASCIDTACVALVVRCVEGSCGRRRTHTLVEQIDLHVGLLMHELVLHLSCERAQIRRWTMHCSAISVRLLLIGDGIALLELGQVKDL